MAKTTKMTQPEMRLPLAVWVFPPELEEGLEMCYELYDSVSKRKYVLLPVSPRKFELFLECQCEAYTPIRNITVDQLCIPCASANNQSLDLHIVPKLKKKPVKKMAKKKSAAKNYI